MLSLVALCVAWLMAWVAAAGPEANPKLDAWPAANSTTDATAMSRGSVGRMPKPDQPDSEKVMEPVVGHAASAIAVGPESTEDLAIPADHALAAVATTGGRLPARTVAPAFVPSLVMLAPTRAPPASL